MRFIGWRGEWLKEIPSLCLHYNKMALSWKMNEWEIRFNKKAPLFSSSHRPTAPSFHNSPALLSHDVKTLSRREWQQRGLQMLTFNDNSPLLFLLSVPLMPSVGTERRLQATAACRAFDGNNACVSQALAECSSVCRNVASTCFFLPHRLCTLAWKHHLIALLLLNAARWTCYFKTGRFIPRSTKNFLNCTPGCVRPQ